MWKKWHFCNFLCLKIFEISFFRKKWHFWSKSWDLPKWGVFRVIFEIRWTRFGGPLDSGVWHWSLNIPVFRKIASRESVKKLVFWGFGRWSSPGVLEAVTRGSRMLPRVKISIWPKSRNGQNRENGQNHHFGDPSRVWNCHFGQNDPKSGQNDQNHVKMAKNDPKMTSFWRGFRGGSGRGVWGGESHFRVRIGGKYPRGEDLALWKWSEICQKRVSKPWKWSFGAKWHVWHVCKKHKKTQKTCFFENAKNGKMAKNAFLGIFGNSHHESKSTTLGKSFLERF